jgi:hypothetical protein
MSSRASRLVWFRFSAHGKRWRVVLVPRLVADTDGAELFGVTTFRRSLIEIAAWQPWGDLCETVLHEIMHAAGDTRGKLAEDVEAEERYIARAEGPLWNILAQCGFALPPFPRGFEAMRERAIAARGQG